MRDNWREKLCETELELLLAVTSVCEKLNLTYVICAGTLLGAIRHKGFIPWDDDIDISMPREDYEIFLEKAKDYLPKKYVIQHYKTEPNTNALWAKVRNSKTLFLENDNADFDINHGIFIDIFPQDRIKTGKMSYKIEYYKRHVFNFIAGCYCIPYVESIRNPFKRWIGRMTNRVICSNVKIATLLEKEDLRRSKQNTKGVVYPIHFFENRGVISAEDFFETSDYSFEGILFKGPKNYDRYLELMYGDYMKIPSVEKQITHKPLKIMFEDDFVD